MTTITDSQFSTRVAGLARSGATLRKNGQELATDAILWAQERPDNAPARAFALLKGLVNQPRLFSAMKTYLTAAGFNVTKHGDKLSVKAGKKGVALPAHCWMESSPKKAAEKKPFDLEKFLQGAARRGGIEIAVLQAYVRSNSFANEIAKLQSATAAVKSLHKDGETPMAVKRKARKAAQAAATTEASQAA